MKIVGEEGFPSPKIKSLVNLFKKLRISSPSYSLFAVVIDDLFLLFLRVAVVVSAGAGAAGADASLVSAATSGSAGAGAGAGAGFGVAAGAGLVPAFLLLNLANLLNLLFLGVAIILSPFSNYLFRPFLEDFPRD